MLPLHALHLGTSVAPIRPSIRAQGKAATSPIARMVAVRALIGAKADNKACGQFELRRWVEMFACVRQTPCR